MLKVMMVPPRYLFQCGNSLSKVAIAHTPVQSLKMFIKFSGTYNLLAPSQRMVKEKFVACMKYFGCEERCRVGRMPIAPEWPVNSQQAIIPSRRSKPRNLPWINFLFKPRKRVQCALARTGGMRVSVAKFRKGCH